MSDMEHEPDFDALERELEIDRQVRLGRNMLDFSENVAALAETHRRVDALFDQLESLLDQLEKH